MHVVSHITRLTSCYWPLFYPKGKSSDHGRSSSTSFKAFMAASSLKAALERSCFGGFVIDHKPIFLSFSNQSQIIQLVISTTPPGVVFLKLSVKSHQTLKPNFFLSNL